MSVRFCRSASVAMIVWVAAGITVFQTVASAQVAGEKLSHVAFDIRVDKALAYLESVGMETDSVFGPSQEGEMIKSIVRVYGAAQLPPDMETAMALIEIMELGPPPAEDRDEMDRDEKMPSDGFDDVGDLNSNGQSPVSLKSVSNKALENELPVNFFFRIQFNSEAAAQSFAEEAQYGSEERVIDGETFQVPPAESGAPSNLLFHIIDGTTFEAGTTEYLTQPSRKLFTKRLEETWSTMPAGAFRVAADLESVSPLLSDFVQMAKDNAPPAAGGMLDLLPKISTLKLGADFTTENIVSLTITGKDEQQSEELRTGIDGLLAMAKMFGGQGVQEIGRESPEAGKMVEAVLGSLTATRTGNDVAIAIARPDGFDDAIRAMMALARERAKEVNRMNEVRQIGLSLHIYYDAHMQFPQSGSETALSWRAMVCPYMESNLDFDFEKPFSDPVNAAFADKMPEAFGAGGKLATICRISNDGFPKSFEQITDGTSNTIMLLENPAGVPWLEPVDLTIDEAVRLVTRLKEGESLIAAMYDGSVMRLKSGLTEEQIKPFFTFQGGEIPDYDVLYR